MRVHDEKQRDLPCVGVSTANNGGFTLAGSQVLDSLIKSNQARTASSIDGNGGTMDVEQAMYHSVHIDTKLM